MAKKQGNRSNNTPKQDWQWMPVEKYVDGKLRTVYVKARKVGYPQSHWEAVEYDANGNYRAYAKASDAKGVQNWIVNNSHAYDSPRVTSNNNLTRATTKNGEVRYVDLNKSKDFNGTTGYKYYDPSGNEGGYTRYEYDPSLAESTSDSTGTYERTIPSLVNEGINIDFPTVENSIPDGFHETMGVLFPNSSTREEEDEILGMHYDPKEVQEYRTREVQNNMYNGRIPTSGGGFTTQAYIDNNPDAYTFGGDDPSNLGAKDPLFWLLAGGRGISNGAYNELASLGESFYANPTGNLIANSTMKVLEHPVTLATFAGLSAANMAGPNGIRKTWKLGKDLYDNGWDANTAGEFATSLGGDILDGLMMAPVAMPALREGTRLVADAANLAREARDAYLLRSYKWFSPKTLDNVETTNWYKDIAQRFGSDYADYAAALVKDKDFQNYFLAGDVKKAKEVMDRFSKQRDILSKITGSTDEGKGVIGGSSAISHEGTIDRSEAATHDLDINAYMGDATKTTTSDPSPFKHPELNPAVEESRRRMSSAPIYDVIAQNYPEFENYTVRFPSFMGRVGQKLHSMWDQNRVLGHFPNPFPSLYKEGVFNVSPMYNVSPHGANRTVMTKINGEPVDIFISDTYIPENGGFLSADNVLAWKQYFTNRRNQYIQEHGFGLPPRPKDINDVANYRPFSAENKVISEDGTSQYAPFSFKENSLISEEGLPILSSVETYPGSGTYIPSFMNWKGEFYPMLPPASETAGTIARQNTEAMRARAAAEEAANWMSRAKKIAQKTKGFFTKNSLHGTYSPTDTGALNGSTTRVGTLSEDLQNKFFKIVEEHVLDYVGSDRHIQRIMESGKSENEAREIAEQMRQNVMKAVGTGKIEKISGKPRGMYTAIGVRDSDSPLQTIGKTIKGLAGYVNPAYTIDARSPLYLAIEDAIHELGGHGATLGYSDLSKETNLITRYLGKLFNKTLDKSFPKGREVYEHNASLMPVRKPEYMNDDSSFIRYLEDVDEYSSRARTENMMPGSHGIENLYDYFTKESVDNLINGVWEYALPIAGAGTVYGLSQGNNNVQALGGPLVQAANKFNMGGPEDPPVGSQYMEGTFPGKFYIPVDIGTDIEIDENNNSKKVARRAVEYHGNGEWGAHLFADDGTYLGYTGATFLGPSENGIPPYYYENNEKKYYPESIIKLEKANPGVRGLFTTLYKDFYFDPDKLYEVYEKAGSPSIQYLPENDTRAGYYPSLFGPGTIQINNPNVDTPWRSFNDIIDELSHPIQEEYGNNSVLSENLNPFYDVDDYRGHSRYYYPNTYEGETHGSLAKLLSDYVKSGNFFGQSDYPVVDEKGNTIHLGNDDYIMNATLDQVLDSAKTYNQRVQDNNYRYPEGDYNHPRNSIKSWFGDLYSNGGPLVQEANMFKNGGPKKTFKEWKKRIKEYKGLDVDNDPSYDYRGFYYTYPDKAWAMLKDDPSAHFTDEFKTIQHPTYSEESRYSRSPYIMGGSWRQNYIPNALGQEWNYRLSPNQVNANWDVLNTIDYATDSENNGLYVTDSEGRYPVIDGIVEGGVLPNVEVLSSPYLLHAEGGQMETPKQWSDLSVKEKADMMKVAIRNGITDLSAIKEKYNEFCNGGSMISGKNLYALGGIGFNTGNNLLGFNSSNSAAIRNTEKFLNNFDRRIASSFNKANQVSQMSESDLYRNPYNPSLKYSSSAVTPSGQNAIQYAINYFVNKGLERHQAIGLVANLMRESGLDPGVYNYEGSGAFGLAQWLGDRRTRLFAKYGRHPTFQNELDFIWEELNSTHRKGLQMLRASRSAEEAAANAFGYYEFSAGPRGAVAAMNRSGQNGQAALNKGINYARQFSGLPAKDAEYPSYFDTGEGYKYDAENANGTNNDSAISAEYYKMFLDNQDKINKNNDAIAHMQAMIDTFNAKKAEENELAQLSAQRMKAKEKQNRNLAFVNNMMGLYSGDGNSSSSGILGAITPLLDLNMGALGGELNNKYAFGNPLLGWDANKLVAPLLKSNIRSTVIPNVSDYYSGNTYIGNTKGNPRIGKSVPSNHAFYKLLPQLFAADGVSIKIYSGHRPGAMTAQGLPSQHDKDGHAADIGPVGQSTFADILRVLDDPNSTTSRWLLANGYGYLNETIPATMKRTGATGPHFHIGMDSGLASSYAKRMNYKYNPKVTPNYTMPTPGNHIGPALPPVENNVVPDKDLLAQSETIDQQNEKVAELDSRWQTLMQQEADAAKAAAEAKLKAEKDKQRAFGLNLAMGIINGMSPDAQGSTTSNLLNSLTGGLYSNMSSYGGPLVKIANKLK